MTDGNNPEPYARPPSEEDSGETEPLSLEPEQAIGAPEDEPFAEMSAAAAAGDAVAPRDDSAPAEETQVEVVTHIEVDLDSAADVGAENSVDAENDFDAESNVDAEKEVAAENEAPPAESTAPDAPRPTLADFDALSPHPGRPAQVSPLEGAFFVLRYTLRRQMQWRRLALAFLVIAAPLGLALLMRNEGSPGEQETFFHVMVAWVSLPLIPAILALTLATSFPWPQADEGTLTYWYSSPVPRWAILLGHYGAWLLFGFCLLPLSVLALGLPLDLQGARSLTMSMLTVTVGAACVFPAYMAIYSALSSFTRKAAPIGVAYLMFDVLAAMAPNVLQRFTLTYYARCIVWPMVENDPGLRDAAVEAYFIEESTHWLPAGIALLCAAAVGLAVAGVIGSISEYRGKQSESG